MLHLGVMRQKTPQMYTDVHALTLSHQHHMSHANYHPHLINKICKCTLHVIAAH